jgi:hypothetical protein
MAASTSASQFALSKKSLDEWLSMKATGESTVATWGGAAACV